MDRRSVFLTLLKKDLHEHGWVMVFLLVGVAVSVSMVSWQNQHATSGVGLLRIVHTFLLSLLPLIAFITGQRLIVSEYLGRTRWFVEALPVRPSTLVTAKFTFGWLYIVLIAIMVLGYIAYQTRALDAIDLRYFSLLLVKTISVSTLLWSIVFCFSLFGAIRMALYTGLVITVLMVISSSAFDASQFGPFALLDAEIFALERVHFPWSDILETGALALFFTLTGYAVALLQDGGIAERLAKPISRQDIVVTAILACVGFYGLSKLLDEPVKINPSSGSSNVLRNIAPPVLIDYRSAALKQQGENLMSVTLATLRSFQSTLGVSTAIPVRFSHDNNLDPEDLRISANRWLSVSGNFSDFDAYEINVVATLILHATLHHHSGSRLLFEPYHWMLDGLTRWWVETYGSTQRQAHHAELLALASYALSQLEQGWTLSSHWQLIAERVGYPAAEALAYSAIWFLAKHKGDAAIEQLATTVLLPRRTRSSVTTFKTWLRSVDDEFAGATNWALSEFFLAWKSWLKKQRYMEATALYLNRLPRLRGEIVYQAEKSELQVNLDYLASHAKTVDDPDAVDRCRGQHQIVSPFDHEMMQLLKLRRVMNCNLSNFSLPGTYGSGDRVYAVLELLTPVFHAPLRIWQGRVNIP